jgi:hypothetical protein
MGMHGMPNSITTKKPTRGIIKIKGKGKKRTCRKAAYLKGINHEN